MNESDLLARIDDVTVPSCAQCDGPLGDSVSDDFCTEDCQIRWAARHADRRLPGSISPTVNITPEEARQAALRLCEAFQRAAEAMKPAVEAYGRALTDIAASLRQQGLISPVTPRDETPAARALRLRQQRNTGPRVHADPRRNRR